MWRCLATINCVYTRHERCSTKTVSLLATKVSTLKRYICWTICRVGYRFLCLVSNKKKIYLKRFSTNWNIPTTGGTSYHSDLLHINMPRRHICNYCIKTSSWGPQKLWRAVLTGRLCGCTFIGCVCGEYTRGAEPGFWAGLYWG